MARAFVMKKVEVQILGVGKESQAMERGRHNCPTQAKEA
jgi:hypothetical protein